MPTLPVNGNHGAVREAGEGASAGRSPVAHRRTVSSRWIPLFLSLIVGNTSLTPCLLVVITSASQTGRFCVQNRSNSPAVLCTWSSYKKWNMQNTCHSCLFVLWGIVSSAAFILFYLKFSPFLRTFFLCQFLQLYFSNVFWVYLQDTSCNWYY